MDFVNGGLLAFLLSFFIMAIKVINMAIMVIMVIIFIAVLMVIIIVIIMVIIVITMVTWHPLWTWSMEACWLFCSAS